MATIRKVVDDIIERVKMWQNEQKIEDIRRRMWAGSVKSINVPEIRKPGRMYVCSYRPAWAVKRAVAASLSIYLVLMPPFSDLSACRSLFSEGDIMKRDRKNLTEYSKRHMFVFDDMLLYVKAIEDKYGSTGVAAAVNGENHDV